jgi:hypothetical protein
MSGIKGIQVRKRSDIVLIVVLLLLNGVPIAAGIERMVGMGLPTPENARFVGSPIATALHIVSSSVFGLVGIGQFIDGFRRRYAAWHRRAGWVLAISGLVSALSGLWMTGFFPRVKGDSDLLDLFRLIFGVAMVVCLLFGLYHGRRRNFQQHSAWMIRGYAIGMGAGTQVVLFIPWVVLVAPPGALERALLLGAGWATNLLLAEWWVARRHRRRPANRPPLRSEVTQ